MGERIDERFATVRGYAFRQFFATYYYFSKHTPPDRVAYYCLF